MYFKRNFLLKLISILFVFTSSDAIAKWQVIKKVDKMNDKVTYSASIISKEGYSFSLYRNEFDEKVNAMFLLPTNKPIQITRGGGVTLRVDKNKSQHNDIELAHKWRPKGVEFLIWHGVEKSGVAPIINELMSGKKLLVRFVQPSGSEKIVEFTLQNSTKVIMDVFSLSNPNSARAKKIEKYTNQLKDYILINNDNASQRNKIIECNDINVNHNLPQLEECIANP